MNCENCGIPFEKTVHNKRFCCKSCRTKWYIKTKYREKHNYYARLYIRRNKEKVKARKAKYYAENKEKIDAARRKYIAENLDHVRELQKKSRERCKVENRATKKAIYERNKGRDIGKAREIRGMKYLGIDRHNVSEQILINLALIRVGKRICKTNNCASLDKDSIKPILQAIEEGRTHEAYE